MAKFTKTVEAVQWFKMGDHEAVEVFYGGGHNGEYNDNHSCFECDVKIGEHGYIPFRGPGPNDGGNHLGVVCPGKWIVEEQPGMFYAYSEKLFAEMFTPVSELAGEEV